MDPSIIRKTKSWTLPILVPTRATFPKTTWSKEKMGPGHENCPCCVFQPFSDSLKGGQLFKPKISADPKGVSLRDN